MKIVTEFLIGNEVPHYNTSEIVDQQSERVLKGEPIRIACFDIDSTLTSTPDEQQAVRDRLKELGYSVIFVSSRTEEMMMDRASYELSAEIQSQRPSTKLKAENTATTIDDQRQMVTQYSEAFADEILSFKGLYNAEVIISQTGARVCIRQQDGSYIYDPTYNTDVLEYWRENAFGFVQSIQDQCPDIEYTLGKVDQKDNYPNGLIDVAPPNRRIQLEFGNYEQQKRFEEAFKGFTEHIPGGQKPFEIIEDGNASHDRYQIYLVPEGVNKQTGVDHAIKNIITSIETRTKTKVDIQSVEMLYAGDSAPDVRMGMLSVEGAQNTFIIVAGSRLSKKTDDGVWVLQDSLNSEKFNSFGGLVPSQDQKGVYISLNEQNRKVILGDSYLNFGNEKITNTRSILNALSEVS